MKLSWSHTLFLAINRSIGKYPMVDRWMFFCGHWLIYPLYLALFFWGAALLYARNIDEFRVLRLVGIKSLLLAFLISYAIGMLWPHRRPKKELFRVRVLVEPLGNWKSFPSDHTIAATLTPLLVAVSSGPWWLVGLFVFAALSVALGRIYIGVHYPRDILGGIVVACISLWLIMHYG